MRKFVHRIGTTLAALVIALSALQIAVAAGVPQSYETFGYLKGGQRSIYKFVFSSDSHLGYGPANRNTELAFRDMVEREKNIAFGVVVGDITETGAASEYALFKELSSKLPFPMMGAMGNHESRWQDPQGSLLAATVGPRNYSFDYGSWHFVVLDSTFPGQTLGTLSPETLKWLEEDLRLQPGTKPVAIFSHHPLLYEPSRFQDSDDAFAAILDKYPIRVVFTAHGHSFIPWKGQGRDFLMTGALMDGAYTVVEVDGRSLTAYAVKVTDQGTDRQQVLKVSSSRWNTKKDPMLNPVKSFKAEYSEGVLTCTFELTEAAAAAMQVDGGGYNDLGELGKGSHTATIDMSGQVNGFHRSRLRIETQHGPFYVSAEFGKNTDNLTLWRHSLGSAVVGELTPRGARQVVAGTRDGKVRLIDIETGEPVWEYNAGSPWGGGVIDGDRLYFGTSKGEVHCVSLSTGTAIWRSSVDTAGFAAAPAASTTGGERRIVIGSTSGTLYSLNAVTGSLLWSHSTTGAIASTPRVSDGVVAFGAWDGYLYAADEQSGIRLWSQKMGRQVYYSPYLSPVIHEGVVYATTPYDTHAGGALLAAYDLHTGVPVWEQRVTFTLMAPTVSLDQELVVPGANGNIYAFSLLDGTQLWRMEGASILFGAPPGQVPEYVSGGYRGLISFLTHETRTDFKFSDSCVFVSPLVMRGTTETIAILADSQGVLSAVRFPK